MDPLEEGNPSRRARRALPLIAAALSVTVVASLLYLHANPPQTRPQAKPPLSPGMLGEYIATYDFVNPLDGWAVVEAQQPLFWVFKTTDGAKHWQRLSTGVAVPGPATVRFFDREDGVISVLSNDSVVVRTGDGGLSWRSLVLPAESIWVAFADQIHGWAVAGDQQQQLLRLRVTNDGGATWTQMTWPSGAPMFGKRSWFDPHFRATGEGWLGAIGPHAGVFRTSDFGYTWGASDIPAIGGTHYTTEVNLLPGNGVVAFVTDDHGIVTAFTSFDQGESWGEIKSPPGPATLQDVTYLDAQHWWAMRAGYLFKTSDAAKSWTEVHMSPLMKNWNYLPAKAIDAKHAWSQMVFTLSSVPITGLAMTSDGGSTWRNVNVPNPDVNL